MADPRWKIRLWAADALGKLGPDAKDAVPALSGLVKDGEPQIRQTAADALGRIGSAAEKATPVLIGLLTDQTWIVRNAAATALLQIGPVAKADVTKIAALLHDPRWDVRRQAAELLGSIGTPGQEATASLKNLLADCEPAVRIAAATALTKVAPKAEEVVSPIARLLGDVHPGVASWPPICWATSVPPRRHPSRPSPRAARWRVPSADRRGMRLGRIGPDAKAAFPAVAALLNDDIADVREETLVAIAGIKAKVKTRQHKGTGTVAATLRPLRSQLTPRSQSRFPQPS